VGGTARGSHLVTAVVVSALTILVVGGAALANSVTSKGAAAATSAKIPAAAGRQAAVTQLAWYGYVNFIDGLDQTSYMGIGGSARVETQPGAIGTVVDIAGTLGNFQARVAQAPSNAVTFTAYTNAASSVTCTITPPAVSCSDNVDTLALTADKLLKIQVTNSGTGPIYGARWSATYTPS
jgi:hypothetical protein